MYMPPYQPRTDLPHRETLEKDRLKRRREKFTKIEVVTDPVQPAADLPLVPSFESDHDRYVRPEERSLAQKDKQEKALQRQKFYEARRRQIQLRETRYKSIEDEAETKDLRRVEFLREKTKKNFTGQAFNIVSLQYRDDAAGRDLKARHEYSQYRSDLRGYLVALRSGFCNNPITGEPLLKMTKPEKPASPV